MNSNSIDRHQELLEGAKAVVQAFDDGLLNDHLTQCQPTAIGSIAVDKLKDAIAQCESHQ